MSKRLHYNRSFLNNEEFGGGAYVEAIIHEVETGRDDSKHFSASLSISDCSRVVSLDFDCYTPERVEELRQKIARLRRIVCAFERVLITQLDEVGK